MKINSNPWLKSLALIAFLAAVFIGAVGFWYSPVLFKGYATEPLTERIPLARNYALTGRYAVESDLNVALAPELAKDEAHESTEGNKFGTVSYSWIFRLLGWQSWNNLVLVNVAVYAMSLALFTLAVCLLFGFWPSALFAAIYILLPFNGSTARIVSYYEFAQLYLSLFVLGYFVGRKSRFKYVFMAASGIFLSLACLAREAFFIFLPIFFFWLFWQKRKRELLAVFIPVGLIIGIFWLPAIFAAGSQNDYAKLFAATDQKENNWTDFPTYGHLFPDPYSFHFDRQAVVDKINADLADETASWFYKIDRLKVSKNFGVREINYFERLIVGLNIAVTHLAGYLDIGFIGGPMILILMMAGFWELGRKDRSMSALFAFWFAGSLVLWSFFALVIRNHLMDSGWIIALLAALALAGLPALLRDHYRLNASVPYIAGLVIAAVFYGLILGNHVSLGQGYDGGRSLNLSLDYLAQKIIAQNVSSTDVIAVSNFSAHPVLNYLTGKSDVYFAPETVMRLAQENKLQDAFDKFGVKYVAGYDDAVSSAIASSSRAVNISSWPKPEDISKPASYDQMWLMNILK